MKKRILSAALFLAVVLTMLSLTALAAAPSNDGKTTVTYYDAGKVYTDENGTTNAAGWYYDTGRTTNTPKANTHIYEKVETGVIDSTGSSGKYYESVNAALAAGKTSIKLLDDATGVDLTKATGTSATIDLNGHTIEFSTSKLDNVKTDSNQNPTKLTSLTVQNSVKTADNKWPKVEGTITATNQGFTYTGKNTSNDSSLTLTVTGAAAKAATLKVTLNDASVDALTADYGAVDINVTGTLSTSDGAKIGNINVNQTSGTNLSETVNYGSNKVVVKGATVGDIKIKGKTGSGTNGIHLSDMAVVSNIQLDGGTKNTTTNKFPAWGGDSLYVTIVGRCQTGDITDAAGNEAAVNVSFTGGSGNVGISKIDLDSAANHSVTVTGGKVDEINMAGGRLTINGGATVGDDPATHAKGVKVTGKTTVTVGDSNTKVGKIDATGATADSTVTITGGTFGVVNLQTGYNKQTISGGTFYTRITESGWLKNVTYEIRERSSSTSTDWRYTFTSSIQDCVNAYKNVGTEGGSALVVVTMVGVDNLNNRMYADFYLDAPDDENAKPVLRIGTDENHGIILPKTINNKPITVWYMGNDNTPRDAGALVKLTGVGSVTKFKATTSSADNSEITKVTADYSETAKDSGEYHNLNNPGLSATLSGTTIKVSGALKAGSSGFVDIDLLVETALGKEYHISVAYAVAEKVLVPGTLTGSPFEAGTDNRSILVKGTTKVYTLDGSGLTVQAGGMKEVETKTCTSTVSSVSGVTGTVEKAALTKALEATTADFSGSPAVLEAVNKKIAELSATQVANYIHQGRVAAWKALPGKTGNPTESDLDKDVPDYDQLELVLTLDIKVTRWDKTAGAQSLELNISPAYRLDVVSNTAGHDAQTVVKGGTLSLTNCTGDLGKVDIKLDSTLTAMFAGDLEWAHHGNYVYHIVGNTFTTSHGFSPFVLNKVDPVAKVYVTEKTDEVYYDNVQTAIDNAKEDETVKLFPNYGKKAETYTFTGKARTITFDPGLNGDFVPTFTGAHTAAKKTNGNVWTVQLNADTAVATASISLGTFTNGTASLSTTNAAQGSTVTITTTPNTGYKALTPTVTANTGAVSVSAGSNGTFTFTVPAGATSITVTPAFVLGDLPFTDVAEGAWYYDGVAYCYNTFAGSSRLMQGMGDNVFGTNTTMTRAQIVEILWRMSGSPAETAKVTFSDVAAGYWAYNSIAWAANHGIVEGYGDGTFLPNGNITRQELAQMLWKYDGKPSVSTNLNNFPDGGSVQEWARNALMWAAGRGILSGRSSATMTRLDAKENAFRSELAVTIMKYHQYHFGY